MPLFHCSKCEVIENTSLGKYWREKSKGLPVLCSECATGAWHGQFSKSYGPIEKESQA